MSGDERRILGEADCYDDLHHILRVRAAELGASREAIDHAAGLQTGYAGKLLGSAQVKRLGSLSWPLMLQALGLGLLVVEKPTRHSESIRGTANATGRKAILSGANPTTARRRALARELGKQGAAIRNATMTAAERKAWHSAGGKARWRKHRRDLRLAREARNGTG